LAHGLKIGTLVRRQEEEEEEEEEEGGGGCVEW